MVLLRSYVVSPSTGRTVAWTLTKPVADLAGQCEMHGFYIAGTIGNPDHLDGHGDHTPWSAGKLPGWIYALDARLPADFERWIVDTCKRDDYETSWIDFFNINGSQYNNAGRRVADSDDKDHLHISVNKGFEHTSVTLFDDYAQWKAEGDMPSVSEFWEYKIDSPTLKVKGRSTADWLKQAAETEAKVDKLTTMIVAANAADETRDRTALAAIGALTSALKGGGTVDQASIIAAIRAEGEKTRAEVAARAAEILNTSSS